MLLAAGNGNFDVVNILLADNADVNANNDDGDTGIATHSTEIEKETDKPRHVVQQKPKI